jgi:adenylate cyclase
MPSTRFADDLKWFLRSGADRARSLAAMSRQKLEMLQARLRTLPKTSRVRLAVGVAGAIVFTGALALRGNPAAPARPAVAVPEVRLSTANAQARTVTSAAQRTYSAGKAQEAEGSYRTAAESYAEAARQGDARGIDKLIAMTRAPKCEARSQAAEALAGFRNRRSAAALRKLQHGHFRDEGENPGIFGCNSRRAAQKALDKQGRAPSSRRG